MGGWVFGLSCPLHCPRDGQRRQWKNHALGERNNAIQVGLSQLRGFHQLPIAAAVGFGMRVGRVVLMVDMVIMLG